MVEKQFVSKEFKVPYSGPFVITEFYDAIDKWAHEKHYHVEIKEHLEHNASSGKEIIYSLELYKHVNTQVIAMIQMQARFGKIRDVTITTHSHKHRVQHGSGWVKIEGLVERHKLHSWENKPYIYFFRAWMDRFVYKNLYEQHFGLVSSDTRAFYDFMKGFFHKEEMRLAA